MKDRQAIYFNESGYELELKNYREKKTLESLILTEFKKLTPDHKFKPDFNNDVMNSFYSQLEGEHSKHNPLKIRGAKLCELMELDTKMLKSYSLQYKRFVDIKSPRKDTFTIYAHTEKELYKLDFAKRLIDMLNETKEHRNIHWNTIVSTFGDIVKLNGISEFVVNPNFIKK